MDCRDATVKMKLKKWPWWVKGGVGGILWYVWSVSITIAGLAVGLFYEVKMPTWLFDPFSSIVKLFGFFSFYPALWLVGDYQALYFIIPVNLLFYCLVGVLVAFLVKAVKEGVELI